MCSHFFKRGKSDVTDRLAGAVLKVTSDTRAEKEIESAA